jgi:lysozyme family protein
MMAKFSLYFPKLLLFEGGFGNDSADKGGPTKFGVILKEWISKGYDKDHDGDIDVNDLKLITVEDAAKIAKPYYWDKVKGDLIKSQSVAEFITDWAYNSGVGTATKKTQRLLGLPDDGDFGPNTLLAVNNADPKTLFDRLKASREAFYRAIVQNNPSQNKFLKGWLNRNNSFKFES